MTFETILRVEQDKINTMKQNNKELKSSDKINNRAYNHTRMVLNGIEAVKRLKGC